MDPLAEDREQRLRIENDYMKMKLMLERGATFTADHSGDHLSPEVENQFLKNVIEMEKHYDHPVIVKVFDKIGQPSRFVPVAEITDEEMEKAWLDLSSYLYEHGIDLGVCSPNVTHRELYRFATEELFQHEIHEFNIPGMVHGFIYDEFHPDPVYEATWTAVEYGINDVLAKRTTEWMPGFANTELRLNNNYPLLPEEFQSRVIQFKNAWDSIEREEVNVGDCKIEAGSAIITGSYRVTCTIGGEAKHFSGNWKVVCRRGEIRYWEIVEMMIEGISF